MFHVKQFINNTKIHELLFYVFLFLIPIQSRILYFPDRAYIDWYFNYHLAFFVYLTDLVLILCFATWWLFDRPKFHVKQIDWLILAFLGVGVISMFRVKHLDFGLYQLFKWVELFLVVFYVKQTFVSQRQFIVAAYTIFVTAVLQAILGLWQFHVQHMVGLSWLGEYIAPLGTPGLATVAYGTEKVIRAYGTFPHPNILGAFLIFGLFIGLFYVSRETKWRLLLVSCGTIVITLGISVTFSRLAWFTTIFTYLLWLGYMFHVKHWSKLKIIAIIGLVSCGTILFYGYDHLKTRALDQDPTALVDRGTFNHYGLQLISLKPIIGHGAGNYVPALQDLYSLEAWQYQPAHNIFIFIAAEMGIAGLLIFLWILFEILRKLKNISADPLLFTVFCLLITFLLLGQFDHYFVTIQQGRLMFATLLGFTAALPYLNHEELH